MKKNDFVTLVADKSGLSKKDTEAFLTAFNEVMMYEVFAKEDSVRLAIGTFSGITKPARNSRNPRTGEVVAVPEKHGQPKFKPSKAAKE